jgi:hypothetical protein
MLLYLILTIVLDTSKLYDISEPGFASTIKYISGKTQTRLIPSERTSLDLSTLSNGDASRSSFRIILELKYIVTYRSIARQRLGKHIPVGANGRNNEASIARQRIRKHA